MAKAVLKKELQEELQKLQMDKLPRHVAIIMDGNGRWAKKRGLMRAFGHRAGMENVKTAVRFCSDIGVKVLTLFAFSTENWKRPNDEISLLMGLLLEYLKREIKELHEKNVRLNTLGDLNKLPFDVAQAILDAKEKTKNNTGMTLNIALNYGARAEIVQAVKEIARDTKEGRIEVENIDEALFSSYLYTSGLEDPDLIIRTSGEIRVSNFLLYQSAYAEYIFTDILWPDLNELELTKTFLEFQSRQRRFGGV